MKGIRFLAISSGLLLLMACPILVHAEEEVQIPMIAEEQVVKEETEILVEEETSVEDNGISNDELFEQYVDKQFEVESDISDTSLRKTSKLSTIPLEGVNSVLYELLEDRITNVADGNIESTVFSFTDEELQIENASYTEDELGVTSFLDEDGNYLTNQAKTAYYEKIGFDLATVNKSLLYNHPYELYWYDKSISGAIKQSSSFSIGTGLHLTNMRISMMVSSDFSKTGETKTYSFNTDIAGSVQDAVETAQDIVERYESYNDYDKLVAYRDEICTLVDYNDEAAHSETMPYGNPWQMIWVFDGDDETKVVCEGYSKAFDYLCSKSNFENPNLDCYLVSGNMGDEGHMWNIVTFGDNNYMVDITNCDRGTVGYPDKLFLLGNSEGNMDEGYTFTIGIKNYLYSYNDSTIMSYSTKQLTLSTGNYLHAANRAEHTLSLEGNIGVNFYLDLVDSVKSDLNSYVEFTVDGKSNIVNLSDALIQTVGNVNYYRFSVDVTSLQMVSDIKLKVFTSSGDTGYEDIYSVKRYCDKKIESTSTPQKLINLCKALLNYGGHAQLQFGYNTDNLANADLEDTDVSDVTIEQLAPYEVVTAGSEEGITLAGSTLTLNSLTSIKHYFTIAEGHNISEYTFKLNDQELTPVKSGQMYYVEIPNIASKELDTMYTVTVGDYSITYGALSYAYDHVNRPNESDTLKKACRALYKYNQVADAYFV